MSSTNFRAVGAPRITTPFWPARITKVGAVVVTPCASKTSFNTRSEAARLPRHEAKRFAWRPSSRPSRSSSGSGGVGGKTLDARPVGHLHRRGLRLGGGRVAREECCQPRLERVKRVGADERVGLLSSRAGVCLGREHRTLDKTERGRRVDLQL